MVPDRCCKIAIWAQQLWNNIYSSLAAVKFIPVVERAFP